MKKIKEYIINMFNGFCMALADSVPGVSGGTVAFLLGFYDKFINSLDDLFRGNLSQKKDALKYLIKLGIGWVIGFLIAATILSSMFTDNIYAMSSLFIGFIICAIPVVIREEKDNIVGKYKNIIFSILGIIIVVGISLLNSNLGLEIGFNNPTLLTYLYVFIAASIAITAMVLPGISGSTLLLIFGIYVSIITSIKEVITFNLSNLPILIVFAFGMLFGIVFFIRLIKIGLKKYRSQIIYLIIGMMLGSLYSIVIGPTTLDIPQKMLTFKTFNYLFFVIGALIIIIMELVKKYLDKK